MKLSLSPLFLTNEALCRLHHTPSGFAIPQIQRLQPGFALNGGCRLEKGPGTFIGLLFQDGGSKSFEGRS
jgi:hypothetical protein